MRTSRSSRHRPTRAARAVPPALALVLAAMAAPLATLATAPPGAAAPPERGHCARQARVDVPRAEVQETACLADLTTAGTLLTGHTNQSDWNGLHATGTDNPSGVPGI